MGNPFKPAFGATPAVLAGREQVLADVLEGLDSGPGDPNRTTIFVGPGGSGKTVLLSVLAAEAAQRGWIVAEMTAREGLLGGIVEQIETRAAHLIGPQDATHLTSLGGFGFSVGVQRDDPPPRSWRATVTSFLDALAERGAGLLVTVDEVDPAVGELVALVADYQHLVREGRQVALVMAGLPGSVLRTLTDRSISFVRRATQRRIGNVPLADAALALRQTVEQAGGVIEDAAATRAAQFTGGFPFLIQLVGYHAWREAGPGSRITVRVTRRAIGAATEAMDRMILETTLAELSPRDVEFLRAMAVDSGASRLDELALRMRTSGANAGQYRRRLIAAGVIESASRGLVRYQLPLLRDYLRRHPEP